MSNQLTTEEAIAFAESGKWKDMSEYELALFQLNQDKLCIPFGVFHEAVESAIGRPVWTHEFVEPKRLIDEIEGRLPKSTFGEVLKRLEDRVGKEKVIVVKVDSEEQP